MAICFEVVVLYVFSFSAQANEDSSVDDQLKPLFVIKSIRLYW
jgi:hypothetical protein